jgi:hypothetical protein
VPGFQQNLLSRVRKVNQSAVERIIMPGQGHRGRCLLQRALQPTALVCSQTPAERRVGSRCCAAVALPPIPPPQLLEWYHVVGGVEFFIVGEGGGGGEGGKIRRGEVQVAAHSRTCTRSL